MKKILLIMLVSLSLLPWASFAGEVAEEETLTLGDLSVMGLEANKSIEAKNLVLKSMEIQLLKAKEEAKRYDHMGGHRYKFIQNRIKVTVDPVKAEFQVWKAKDDILKAKAHLRDSIYKKAMAYLQTQAHIRQQIWHIDQAEAQLVNSQLKVKEGLLSRQDYLKAVLDLQGLDQKLLDLEGSLKILDLELSHLIARPLKDITLDTVMPRYVFAALDPQVFYEDHYRDQASIYEKTIDLQTATLEYDLYASKYLEANKEYKLALYKKQLAELALRDAKRAYALSVLKTYNGYLTAKEAYDMAKETLTYKESVYGIQARKLEEGLIASDDLKVYEADVMRAQLGVLDALLVFNTAWLDFENLK